MTRKNAAEMVGALSGLILECMDLAVASHMQPAVRQQDSAARRVIEASRLAYGG